MASPPVTVAFTASSDSPLERSWGIDATRKLAGEGFKRAWLPLIKIDEVVKTKWKNFSAITEPTPAMHFFYFDETKFGEQINPCFFIGGLIFRDKDLQAHEITLSQIQQNFFGTSILTQQTEMHGREIFHGKVHFKSRKLADRLKLLSDIAAFITTAQLPIRIVQIDVIHVQPSGQCMRG